MFNRKRLHRRRHFLQSDEERVESEMQALKLVFAIKLDNVLPHVLAQDSATLLDVRN